jgi:hypothetical protein
MKSARRRYCQKCGRRQHAERDDTPATEALRKWFAVITLMMLAACIVVGAGIAKGYGFTRVAFVFIPVLLAQLTWASFHIREYKRNPFRCIVCGTRLPY